MVSLALPLGVCEVAPEFSLGGASVPPLLALPNFLDLCLEPAATGRFRGKKARAEYAGMEG